MKTKLAALAATMLVGAGVSPASAAIINAPVPVANYITFGGNDWAWAMPCPAVPQGPCGNTPVLDLSFQGPLGWRLPTLAELSAGPSAADFGTPSSFKCAAAYFNSSYSHCDYGDAAAGLVFGSATGGSQYDETWVIRVAGGAVPEPATWALLISGFAMAGAAMRRRSTVAFAA